ncbi:hypothetical protein TEQG_08622 [Trichophyton equinum CBS 127.97]|uniref:Uncharacterized protein n=1 Tax=Trichophyton equinum (strain ATCC MYA-4606 / CBS 127.97) TaxID=559882 RepID=F2PMY2_TRIEC|nr:hypothetical protein TEQG_08622 [Trichophyton equinum CBS 127.97]
MKSNFQILAILSLFFALVLAGRQRPVNPSLGGNNRIDSAMLVDCCHPEYDGKCLDGSKPNPDCGVGGKHDSSFTPSPYGNVSWLSKYHSVQSVWLSVP